MRQIEKQMNNAIRAGRDWKSGNTEVRVEKSYGGAYTQYFATVLLHNHIIAHVTHLPATGYTHTIADRDTFREWPTATTRSRLRALGVNASVSNGRAMIDGMAA